MVRVVNVIACMVVLLFVSSFLAEGQPNGRKPKKVKCQDKNYPQCYHVKLLCPDPCPRTCRVDCVTCQPVCGAVPLPSPSTPTYPPPPARVPTPPVTPPPTIPTPPSSPVPNPPVNPPTTPTPPSSPVPTPVTPPTTPTPTPPSSPLPTPPPSSPLPTPPPSSPVPNPPVNPPNPPSSPVPTPSIPTPVPSLPSSNSTPPNSPPEVAGIGRRVYCKNKNYTKCYRMEQRCPAACPDQCEVDCVTCSPVCDCNRPGAVCQDPRFVGADGITFYFHGKKDKEFCVVADSNLHINAHFIGRRNENMKRDFTWVQSLGILFDDNQIFIGAKKTANWNNEIDRLDLSFNGQPISLSEGEGSKWEPTISSPATGIITTTTTTTPAAVSITRSRDTNAVVIESEGNFQIKATVVPITQKDSRVHKYGINEKDCFAHLDLSFKFYSLSGSVNGVLGQTYAHNYVSRVKMGVAMPVLGGDKEFSSSGLFSTDCAVARFIGSSSSDLNNSFSSSKYAKLKCVTGINGPGVVCRR